VRVAFITVGDTSRLTGGYLYHARVFERLGGLGVEVEEVVPSGASPEEQRAGIPGLAAFDPREYDVVVVDALARVVVAPFVAGWRAHRPVVSMVHELPSVAAPEADDVKEERAFEEEVLGADLLVVVSEHGKSVLEERGVPADLVRIVSPGFDGSSPEGRIRRERAPSGGLRALCVAQWIPRKGVRDLVEAWKAARVSEAVLCLVGETDADPEYSSKVTEAVGGDASISVAGTLADEDLASAYSGSDFFVLPSRFEGYGVVYAEALSFGLPVIACDVGPVPEVVGDGAGIFVSPGDVEGLSRAIRDLVSDGELRRRMSEAALRRVESLPRWDETASRFAGVLREARRG
jgi:glycosyltransferase involved in cell wall biosynthesis